MSIPISKTMYKVEFPQNAALYISLKDTGKRPTVNSYLIQMAN
jgi:hypothetical protein